MNEFCECGHTREQHYNNFITGNSCRVCGCQAFKKGDRRMNELQFEFQVKPAKMEGYLDVTLFLNGQRRGTIELTPAEWNVLSIILKEGNYSQDGEITILVNDQKHAFLEGANG